jgi:hypothetical protein
MHTLDQLGSFDIFFNYGNNDLDLEIESDLMMGLLQPKKSLCGDRSYGAGISDKENYSNTVSLSVGLKYDIALHIAKQNLNINSQNPDRRVATSQNSIKISQSGGNLDVSVLYIPYKDYRKSSTISLPLGVTK